MPERILIVEDEQHIADGLKLNLEAEGFDTTHAADGLTAIEAIMSGEHDLVLLDVMLPGASGFDVCETVRGRGNHVPILFLTARDSDDARIRGLELGGDDYITKPFSIRELIQRVRAIFRRNNWYRETPEPEKLLKVGECTVDFEAFTANTPSGVVTLTQKECMILKLLAEREGQVVTREEIIEGVWGYDRYPSTRTIDNLIVRLRKLLEEDPRTPRYLHTIYAAGYKFTGSPADTK
ncbi:MAG: response regulator transcription factor [Calditrichaeota bacterium]|nr:response regulator transcription factor [Calditrichota bacterium]MCB9365593.1 response regulator transcription factor [Calditrichota bacterium]